MKKLFIHLILLILSILLICNCPKPKLPNQGTDQGAICDFVKTITETEDVDPIVKDNHLVFLTVHNSNNICSNCEELINSLNDLMNNNKICNCVIIKCYNGSNKTYEDLLAQNLIKNGGMTTPACLIYVDGVCQEGYSGYKSTQEIYDLLNKYHMTCEDCIVVK